MSTNADLINEIQKLKDTVKNLENKVATLEKNTKPKYESSYTPSSYTPSSYVPYDPPAPRNDCGTIYTETARYSFSDDSQTLRYKLVGTGRYRTDCCGGDEEILEKVYVD